MSTNTSDAPFPASPIMAQISSNSSSTISPQTQPAHHQQSFQTSNLGQPLPHLLRLPLELRHNIYDHATLSPFEPTSLLWHGLYHTCRQIQAEMRDKLPASSSVTAWADKLNAAYQENEHYPQVPSITYDESGLIDTLTLRLRPPDARLLFRSTRPNPPPPPRETLLRRLSPENVKLRIGKSASTSALLAAYALYIPHLHVVLTHDPDRTECSIWSEDQRSLPYGDLVSLTPNFFLTYVKEGKVNCGAVTFTVERLFERMNTTNEESSEEQDQKSEEAEEVEENVDGKETTIENTIVLEEGRKLVYHLTITQNKEGRQVRRKYASQGRFSELWWQGRVQ